MAVPFESSLDEVSAAIGEAYAQLFGGLASAAVTPIGPPQLRYLGQQGDVWSMQAAVAVRPGTSAPRDTRLLGVPAALSVSAVHRGPYSELGLAYHELNEWAAEHGHEPTGEMVDVYLSDPDTTPPEQLETEVRLLLRS